ncbi:MAG: heme-binding protein [Pseudomonadota bacterium]
MKLTFSALPTLACALLCSQAMAQTSPPAAAASAPTPVPAARGPALDAALDAARTAISTCTERSQKIGVTVLDSAGVIKVVLATDGSSARGVASSTSKALTALQFKSPTSALAEQLKTDKALADKIAADPKLNARAGGILVRVGDEVIGAIGVGGARGSEVDEACAVAGLTAVQSRLR